MIILNNELFNNIFPISPKLPRVHRIIYGRAGEEISTVEQTPPIWQRGRHACRNRGVETTSQEEPQQQQIEQQSDLHATVHVNA